MKLRSKIFGFAFLASQIVLSQNFHHNNEQYGIEGSMLGGAVVAGTDESSMVYYNPASIHNASSGINVSLFQPVIKTFGFDKFWGGNEVNNVDTRFELKPSLLSFKFKIKNQDVAFIKITRSQTDDLFNAQRNTTNGNFLNTQFFDYEFRGSDDWFGFGTSFKLADNFHFGVSQFLSNADYKYKNKIALERTDSVNNNNVTNFFDYNVEANYGNLGFITKIGFSLDTKQHDLGLTITTPTYFRFSKSGDYYATLTNTNNLANTGIIVNNNLSPTIKTPWEFNVGYSFAFKNQKRKIWLSSAYFPAISEYDMDTFTSDNNQIYWRNGSKSVFNFSVGVSEKITPKLELSAGFRTDNFAYENRAVNDDEIRNVILDGNHMHFVFGSKFKLNRSTVLLGVDWGTLTNVPTANELQGIRNLDVIGSNLNNLTKNSFSILLTYGFILDGIKLSRTK